MPRHNFRRLIQPLVAELAGTTCATLIMLGSYTHNKQASQLFSAAAIGAGYTVGMVVAPSYNLNPMFTLASLLFSRCRQDRRYPMSFADATARVVGQLVGTLLADAMAYSSLVSLAYTRGLHGKVPMHDPEIAMSFGVALPAEAIPNHVVFVSSLVFSVLLVFLILAVGLACEKTKPGDSFHCALMVGLAVFAFVCGVPAAAQSNPATWIGGAIFICLAGGPTAVWTRHSAFWWVALVAPFTAACVAVALVCLYERVVWPHGKRTAPHSGCDGEIHTLPLVCSHRISSPDGAGFHHGGVAESAREP